MDKLRMLPAIKASAALGAERVEDPWRTKTSIPVAMAAANTAITISPRTTEGNANTYQIA